MISMSLFGIIGSKESKGKQDLSDKRKDILDAINKVADREMDEEDKDDRDNFDSDLESILSDQPDIGEDVDQEVNQKMGRLVQAIIDTRERNKRLESQLEETTDLMVKMARMIESQNF